MPWIKYSNEQISELLKTKYVLNCTQKYIIFTKECKNKSLKLLRQNFSTKEIFEKLWFPEYIINSKIPQRSFHRWNYKNNNSLIEDKKWRPKKEEIDFENMTLEQENEYLRAKLALY